MDHLLLPDGASHYITVPYMATEPYDGGDFLTYPERKGWATDIEDTHFGGRSADEVNAFLQTWLFFGCLSNILKAAGIVMREDDFIDREHNIVTTKSIPSLVMRWHELWSRPEVSPRCNCVSYQYHNPGKSCAEKHCWMKVIGRRNAPAIRATQETLDRVHAFVDIICSDDRIQDPERTPGELQCTRSRQRAAALVVHSAIAMSISSLCHALEAASHDIYEMPFLLGYRNWRGAFYIQERLQDANWCPSRISIVLDSYKINMRYYCAASPARQGGDHSKCNNNECLFMNIEPKRYRQKHVPGCACGLDSNGGAPPMDEIIEIIRRDGIPVVSWIGGHGDHAHSYGNVSDALANVADLSFKEGGQSRLMKLHMAPLTGIKRYVAISHVWADGLGNPQGNTLPACQLARIQRMVDDLGFFTDDHGHTAFWMDTLCIPVHNKDCRERSIMNMRNIYKQAAAVLVLDSAVQEVSSTAPIIDRHIAISLGGWLQRLWTYQEGVLAKKLCVRFRDKAMIPTDLEEQLSRHLKRLEREKGIYQSSAAPPFINFLPFDLHRSNSLDTPGISENLWRLYDVLSLHVSTRQTTKRSDETLCLASILWRSPSELLQVADEDPEARADHRMEIFLGWLQRFSRNIIFNRLARLKREGYRWAPRSLLANGLMDTMRVGEDKGRATVVGILHTNDIGPRGLELCYPGIEFGAVPSAISVDTFVAVCGHHIYRITLVADHTSDFYGWRHDARYVLVLSQFPSAERPRRIAALGVCKDVGQRKSVLRGVPLHGVRYECRAWVELLSDKSQSDLVCEAVFPHDTRWLIM